MIACLRYLARLALRESQSGFNFCARVGKVIFHLLEKNNGKLITCKLPVEVQVFLKIRHMQHRLVGNLQTTHTFVVEEIIYEKNLDTSARHAKCHCVYLALRNIILKE